MLIVTNGAVTEQQYLAGINGRTGSEVKVKVKYINGTPLGLVEQLTRPQGDASGYDDVFIVVDEDGQDLTAFLDRCRALDRRAGGGPRWQAIISRPCFEVWLVAHYGQVDNYVTQTDAKHHLARLAKRDADDKPLPGDFPWEGLELAAERCQLANAPAPERNMLPSTPGSGMPLLLRELGL